MSDEDLVSALRRRIENLETLDGLLSTLTGVLDVRQVFDRVSAIAHRVNVKQLAFYHLLPSPDSFLTRRLFANGVDEVRKGGWTIAADGSLYTLPIGSEEVQTGSVTE